MSRRCSNRGMWRSCVNFLESSCVCVCVFFFYCGCFKMTFCYRQGPPQHFAPQGWGGGYQPWQNQQHPNDPSRFYIIISCLIVAVNLSFLYKAFCDVWK